MKGSFSKKEALLTSLIKQKMQIYKSLGLNQKYFERKKFKIALDIYQTQ
ncbi:unnamed protein product [Paramecium primaurelia]|uniref:Uncharacterized protein n=1 Tax=Paramecium primaurelia TaxID=5886 RepID=A0A8S1QTT7_PARPR|nr:unnamed protein product [Paramecium primaurelia]